MIAQSIILYGIILSILASSIIVGTLYVKPRLLLQRYPKDVQRMVQEKTEVEKKQTRLVGIPFLLVLLAVPFVSTFVLKRSVADLSFAAAFGNAFGILTVFNLVDLFIIDWLLFVRIRPRFLVIPGSEGAKGYDNFAFHAKGFVSGTVMAAIAGVLIALAVQWA
mgnify:CR=1 FL=1|jgi:hypothetical protein